MFPLIVLLLPLPAVYCGLIRPGCKQNICLKHFNTLNFHRLSIECAGGLYADLGMNGDALGRNMSLDSGSGCITLASGSMKDCSVRETSYMGRKSPVSFTYNCTPEFAKSTAQTQIRSSVIPTAPSTISTADGRTRHHFFTVAAFAVVPVFFLISWFCHLNDSQIFHYPEHGVIFSPCPGGQKGQSSS